MEIIAIIICVAIIGVLAYLNKGGKALLSQGVNPKRNLLTDGEKAKQLEKLADNALTALNCKVKWANEGEVRVAQYDYQNGHFRLHVEKGTPYVRMSYLFCYSSPMDNLDIARMVANKCNINTENSRVVYSVNEKTNTVDMHVIAGLLLHPDTANDTFVDAMGAAFNWQNSIVRKFQEMEENKKETGEADAESAEANRKRELFMLRQQEMRMQGDNSGDFRATLGEGVTIRTLLDKALGIADAQPQRLEVYCNVVEVLKEDQGILDYRLEDLAKELRGEENRKYASAMLWTFLPAAPKVERVISITVTDEGADGSTSWFRVTAVMLPLAISPANPYNQRPDTYACSVLMANDNVSRQQLIDESNYMWKEAVQKVKNGEEDSLSEEQAFIAACTDMELAQLMYHGKKLFLAKRYFEALPYLEAAFHKMQPDFDIMKNRQREMFYEVVYHIGFCYCDLKQYDKALAYLDMLGGLHRITYTTELVNAMVNSGDFRSMKTIDNLLLSINENLDLEEGELPAEHIRSFLAFLNRRKAYLLIEKKRLVEAKELLNKMLEDPATYDYAINELAYIQKLEKERQ